MHSAKADASHSTQRDALNAVIYLFTQSLGRELEKLIFYCAITTRRLPAALTHEKFQQVLGSRSYVRDAPPNRRNALRSASPGQRIAAVLMVYTLTMDAVKIIFNGVQWVAEALLATASSAQCRTPIDRDDLTRNKGTSGAGQHECNTHNIGICTPPV